MQSSVSQTRRPVEGHRPGWNSLWTVLGLLLDKAEGQPPAAGPLNSPGGTACLLRGLRGKALTVQTQNQAVGISKRRHKAETCFINKMIPFSGAALGLFC